MKTISLTLAAVSALAITTPLAAQGWHGDRAGARSPHGQRQNAADLRLRLDAGIGRGTITRREATTLRTDLNALVRLERIYGRDGISRDERDMLRRRGASLERMIYRAESNRMRSAPRAGWMDERAMDRSANAEMDHRSMDMSGNATMDHRGDRFSGDLRIGQHVSDRQVALPVQFRSRYQDNDRSYYRYDSDRVYQIDRTSGLILAMFDVSK